MFKENGGWLGQNWRKDKVLKYKKVIFY